MKKVGIIIPIYNVQNYLKECLESVINQTYKNLEIVLINDGSTDNSINIAKEYARKDSRIVLFSKENEGQSVARNIGIEYFKKHYSFFSKPHKAQKEHSLIEFEVSKKEGGGGLYNYQCFRNYSAFTNGKKNFTAPSIDYIIFLDSDDYWELNCIEECIKTDSKADIIWFCQSWINKRLNLKNGTIINSYKWLKRMKEMKIDYFWFVWQGMIKFSFLKENELKFLEGYLYEDQLFGIQLFSKANTIYILSKILYHYRPSINSTTRTEKNVRFQNMPMSIRKLAPYFKNAYEASCYFKNISTIMIRFYIIHYVQTIQDKQLQILLKEVFYSHYLSLEDSLIKLSKDPLKYFDYILIFDEPAIQTNQIKHYSIANKSEIINCLKMHGNFLLQNRKELIHKNSTIESLKQENQKLKNFNTDLKMSAESLKSILHSYQESLSYLNFTISFGTAKQRIHNHLSYKLGKAMIENSKSILGYIRMPYVLSYIKEQHNKEQKQYQEQIKKNPNLKLPKLESYKDYKEALKEKECFTYKLGEALMKADRTWYKGGYVKLWFEAKRLEREYREKRVERG